MKRSKLAKTLLCVSLLAAPVSAWAHVSPGLKLECGIYSVRGYFKHDLREGSFLILNRGARSQLEFVVLGGSLDERIRLSGRRVRMEVYVPKRIRSQGTVYFQEASIDTEAAGDSVEKIRSEDCELKSRFKP